MPPSSFPLRLLLICGSAAWASPSLSDKLRLDQFGYRPHDPKVAVIADPQDGFNADESYTPGERLEIRRASDDGVVLEIAPLPWKAGATHAQSGDRAWWVDFSELREPGSYYLYDPANDTTSGVFEVRGDVYAEVLRQATRMYYYQRCGTAKPAAFAGESWTDEAAFLRSNQDPVARPIGDPSNTAAARDLRGGWFDAGDYNKYTRWAGGVVMELLLAFDQNPLVFSDDYGIPESGNGIPDLLDEIRWEMDWLRRMQEPSGGLLGKVAVTEFQAVSPPSADSNSRYYGPVSTGATAISAAAFALGATVYDRAGLKDYAQELEAAALRAWEWCEAHPDVPFDNSGFGSSDPGTNDYGRLMHRLEAAIMLFERTGDAEFHRFIEAHYLSAHPIQWTYFYAFEGKLVKALTHYAGLPNADPEISATIRSRLRASLGGGEFISAVDAVEDAYRAYLKDGDYVWGSLSVKGAVGMIYAEGARLGLETGRFDSSRLLDVASDYLHSLHGVNPLGKVMLTNMAQFGAERSLDQIYHSWFGDGTVWDSVAASTYGPPPGYVPGGPNRDFSPGEGLILEPPMNQPVQKSYRDWNTVWPDSSWQVTEPAIYYQSAYIHLLARFVDSPDGYIEWSRSRYWGNTPYADRAREADPDRDGWSNYWEMVFGANPLDPAFSELPRWDFSGLGQARFSMPSDIGEFVTDVERSEDLRTWTSVEADSIEGDRRIWEFAEDGLARQGFLRFSAHLR